MCVSRRDVPHRMSDDSLSANLSNAQFLRPGSERVSGRIVEPDLEPGAVTNPRPDSLQIVERLVGILATTCLSPRIAAREDTLTYLSLPVDDLCCCLAEENAPWTSLRFRQEGNSSIGL